jgi:D-aminopeptidase
VKVFVISDMEGIAGIVRPHQTNAGEALYEEGRKLYTQEINAAVRGAKAGGATEIVVMDCHGAGKGYTFNSLLPEELERTANTSSRTSGPEYTAFLEQGVDAALFVGMHARAGADDGVPQPHGLGARLPEPVVQRHARRRDGDQRCAVRHLGLPGADGHRRRAACRRAWSCSATA